MTALAAIQLELGKAESGKQTLQRAVQQARAQLQTRQSAELWSDLAYALYVGGRLKEAENAMQNALQLDPENEEYPKRMAAIRAAAETIEMSR